MLLQIKASRIQEGKEANDMVIQHVYISKRHLLPQSVLAQFCWCCGSEKVTLRLRSAKYFVAPWQ